MSQYNIWCILDRSAIPFHIDIDKDGTVGELKNAIKERLHPMLSDYAAVVLKLYDIDITLGESDEEDLKKVQDICENLSEHKPLYPTSKLSKVLTEGRVSGDNFYILVIPPPSESFSSRTCAYAVLSHVVDGSPHRPQAKTLGRDQSEKTQD